MRNKYLLITALLIVWSAAHAQNMRENVARSLFADQKASVIGDAVTILVVEATTASNDSKTSSGRSDEFSFKGAVQASSAEAGLGVGNQFRGEGSTASHGVVRAKISTHVDSVLANGNLVVNGKRTVKINGEEQVISISGIVRPSDIMADNSVYSSNLSDATIVFEGNGIVSHAQGPGIFTKFLHLLF